MRSPLKVLFLFLGPVDGNKENEGDMEVDQSTGNSSEGGNDILSQLPQKQRELFLRLQQGQKGNASPSETSTENKPTSE